jgi:hypothetical protein
LIRAMLASLRVAVVNEPKSLRRGRGFAVLDHSLATLGAMFFWEMTRMRTGFMCVGERETPP